MLIENESNLLEWKGSGKSNYLKTVSAFSNYQGGKIIFGVEDKTGHVIGLENIDEQKLAIENAINDGIKPRPKFKMESHAVGEKTILILKVFKGSKPPYIHKNTAYQRQDTSTIPVDEVAFWQLYLEGSNLSFDELTTDESAFTFSKLESELKSVVGITKLTPDLLKTMGLMKGEKYTNAGMLMSDKNDYRYGIDIVRFGETDNIFLERVEIKGQSILTQYESAMAFFDKWYAPYEEVVGYYRETRIHIPREAFREAVANALIHRDYLLKSNIRITMRDSGIEIISPGGLTTGIGKLAFVEGLYSQIRNETLAEVLRRLRIIEKFGTGVKRIRETYQPFKEVPHFDVIDGLAIEVKLPKINYSKQTTDYTSKVLALINDKIETTKKEILSEIGGSDTTLKRSLQNLIKDGKIRRIGSGRATRYQSIK